MWSIAKRLISRWTPLGDAVADVIFEAPPINGQNRNSLLQWRVKRRVDSGRMLISLKLIPDYFGGPDGAVRNYIDFKPEEIEHVTKGLALCLAECERIRNASIASPTA